MKRSMAIIVIIAMCFVSAMAEGPIAKNSDATYESLFRNMLPGIMKDENEDRDILVVENATAWKIDANLTGFMFEGDLWYVYGECETANGLIYKVTAKLPFDEPGLFAAHMIMWTLSECDTLDEFMDKHVSAGTIINDTPMDSYICTLSAISSSYIAFEYTRSRDMMMNNPDNAYDMVPVVSTMQNQ